MPAPVKPAGPNGNYDSEAATLLRFSRKILSDESRGLEWRQNLSRKLKECAELIFLDTEENLNKRVEASKAKTG